MVNLAIEYHTRTEAFDRTVCTGMRNGIAVPLSPRERALISRNALSVLNDIVEREGVLEAELRRAISHSARDFERHLRKQQKEESTT